MHALCTDIVLHKPHVSRALPLRIQPSPLMHFEWVHTGEGDLRACGEGDPPASSSSLDESCLNAMESLQPYIKPEQAQVPTQLRREQAHALRRKAQAHLLLRRGERGAPDSSGGGEEGRQRSPNHDQHGQQLPAIHEMICAFQSIDFQCLQSIFKLNIKMLT